MGNASLYCGEKKYDSVGKHGVEFATKTVFVLNEYHSKYSCN